jgi:hypothetical protein
VSVSDRWHKAGPKAGDVPCKEHSRGTTKLYPTREHMRGERWLVRWRDESGRAHGRHHLSRLCRHLRYADTASGPAGAQGILLSWCRHNP